MIRIRKVKVDCGGDLTYGDAIRDEQVMFNERSNFTGEGRKVNGARVCCFK